MERVDPRLASALPVQLERRRATISAGARHVGWKLGPGEGERIGLELATDVDPDADADDVLVAVGGYGAALEIVDLGGPADGPEEVVAANVYHRAFALLALPTGGYSAIVSPKDDPRAEGPRLHEIQPGNPGGVSNRRRPPLAHIGIETPRVRRTHRKDCEA